MRIGKLSTAIIAAFITLMLSACSAVKITPATTYMISAIPYNVVQRHAGTDTMMVLRPETIPAYDTMQMAYSKCPFQISYYAKNQWAETPSQMLQPLIVKALQCTHHYHAVVTPPYVGSYEYSLNTQIIELLQDYSSPCHPRLRLKVRAQIVGIVDSEVIATKEFCIVVPMRCCSPYGGVLAANIATEMFLEQLARFCVAKTS